MDIVFNINKLGLEGLGATLSSLVRNCSQPKALALHFLCTGLSHHDKQNISRLLALEHFYGEIHYIDFDAQKEFGHLNALHGDRTVYGRLLIPKLLNCDRTVYLDADLIITLDILALQNIDLENSYLGAVYGCPLKCSLDNTFLMGKLGMDPDMPYFNSGVLLFNLKKCREDRVVEQWFAFASKYNQDLISHDQTVLNAFAKGAFALISKNFNSAWYPDVHDVADKHHAIIHFVGSPKPWDLFGHFIHNGHALWKQYSIPFWEEQYGRANMDKIKRIWKIRRSVLRVLKKKFKG